MSVHKNEIVVSNNGAVKWITKQIITIKIKHICIIIKFH